jgi:hypothetical protein
VLTNHIIPNIIETFESHQPANHIVGETITATRDMDFELTSEQSETELQQTKTTEVVKTEKKEKSADSSKPHDDKSKQYDCIIPAACSFVSSKRKTGKKDKGTSKQITGEAIGLFLSRSDFFNVSVKELSLVKFIKEMNEGSGGKATALMTAHIGTERLDNDKLNFTMKKMYLGIQSSKGAHLYQLQMNMIQKTTTLVKYFVRPAGNTILRILGIKESETSDDHKQINYLEIEKNTSKVMLGVFLTKSKKFKSVLSFPMHNRYDSMNSYFRLSNSNNILSFSLDPKTFVVLFTVSVRPELEWFLNVANQCCQISISLQSDKSNSQDDSPNKNTIEGFVTEMISHEDNKMRAVSVAVTSSREIHLFDVEFPNDHNKVGSRLLGKYYLDMDHLKSSLSPNDDNDLNVANFKLNTMFLLPQMKNRLFLIYTAINRDKVEGKRYPRIDILIKYADIRPENKQKEDDLKDRVQTASKSMNTMSTEDTHSVSCSHCRPMT